MLIKTLHKIIIHADVFLKNKNKTDMGEKRHSSPGSWPSLPYHARARWVTKLCDSVTIDHELNVHVKRTKKTNIYIKMWFWIYFVRKAWFQVHNLKNRYINVHIWPKFKILWHNWFLYKFSSFQQTDIAYLTILTTM